MGIRTFVGTCTVTVLYLVCEDTGCASCALCTSTRGRPTTAARAPSLLAPPPYTLPVALTCAACARVLRTNSCRARLARSSLSRASPATVCSEPSMPSSASSPPSASAASPFTALARHASPIAACALATAAEDPPCALVYASPAHAHAARANIAIQRPIGWRWVLFESSPLSLELAPSAVRTSSGARSGRDDIDAFVACVSVDAARGRPRAYVWRIECARE